jgi:microcystin-dependent protein
MASTYSDLKIELIGTGEQVGSWGTTTNTNLGTALEEAITGSATVAFSSVDVTLTLTNTNGTQAARNLRLVCSGTSGGARQLILGAGCQISKLYLIQNDLADTVTVKNTAGTGVAVAAGAKKFVFNDGTNVVLANNVSLTADVSGTLPVANGGTGAATLTANNVLLGNGTSALQAVAPSTSGNVLTSNGTTWASAPAFVTGMIMLWSGSIASIPSGWALCDGNSGRPNLRDKFVVGAGSTYAVNDIGGSADATLVSHTHTASSSTSISDPGHLHTLRAAASGTEAAGFGLVLSASFENRPLVALGAGGGRTSDSASTGISASTSTSITTAGSSATDANLPPYFALAYIIKL